MPTHDNARWMVFPRDTVYANDGHRLGEVVQFTDCDLVVESGLFFRRRYVLSHAEILRSSDGTMLIRLTLDDAKAREQR